VSALKAAVLEMKPAALAQLQSRCRAVGWKYPDFIAEVQRVFILAGKDAPDAAEIDAALAEAEEVEGAPTPTPMERIAADLRRGKARGK
jgi:hypothetical protein